MLQDAAAGPGPRFCLYVHHTEAAREWAYDHESPNGKLDKGLDEAKARGWTVVIAGFASELRSSIGRKQMLSKVPATLKGICDQTPKWSAENKLVTKRGTERSFSIGAVDFARRQNRWNIGKIDKELDEGKAKS